MTRIAFPRLSGPRAMKTSLARAETARSSGASAQDGGQRRTHVGILELKPDPLERARHGVLASEQWLGPFTEQRLERKTRGFHERGPSQKLADDFAQLRVRNRFRRAKVHRTAERAVVARAQQRGN